MYNRKRKCEECGKMMEAQVWMIGNADPTTTYECECGANYYIEKTKKSWELVKD